jgi:uncharacterized membrane protein (UPF0182 family)
MAEKRGPRIILALVLFFLIFLPLLTNGIDLLVDWLWFKQQGFRVVYLTILKAQITLSGIAGMGFIIVAGLNLLVTHTLARRQGYRIHDEYIEFPALTRFTGLLRWAIWAGVLFVGYVISQWGMTHWLAYLLAQHVPVMGQADPLFGIDLGFFLFQLPYTWFLYHLALVTLICCILSATFLYLVEGGVWVTQRGPVASRAARAHLMVLGGILFLLIAYRIRLGMYNLLYSPLGVVYGAGYADVHATLPVLKVLLILAVITAALFFLRAGAGKIRVPLYAIGVLVVVAIVGGAIYPEIVQRFVVSPNEMDKERPYIANSIEFTRAAYGLDRFQEKEFSAVEDLTLDDIQKNDATFRNVRLWDHKPLLTTFAQLQEIRTYYDFVRVDNDRYVINGARRQVSLSPRELSTDSLPSQSWINQHLTYTHGYGLCVGPVNESSPDGLPVLFVKNLPPVSSVSTLQVTRPEIYYGELSNNYCFVKTRSQEFDYPRGDQNVYTSYEGPGGIPVRNFWRRLLFAMKFGQKNILFSSDIQPQSRLMIYRRPLDRVYRLAPFLRLDRDPFIVISQDGSLYWMVDGYTTSSRYPYSDPMPGVGNYIRNSVKATVNAFTGKVSFYIADPKDPFIQAYARIFPGVFHPLSEMPEDLRTHIRYPEDFFTIQASKYALFHMTDPQVFYNREDMWRVAQSAAGGNAPMTPYYTIMKLAEVGQSEEFILMVPFTPARKDNMIAWMAARCDPPNYGKVLVFTFPKQKLVYGPQQIESRIDQDPGISQQLTLWGQGGSTVIRGTLLVTPVYNSVLYVEPLYLAAQAGGGLPQLKRVIVAYSDNVVMEASLDAALSKIFGGTVSTTEALPAVAPPGQPATAATPPAAQPAAFTPATQALIREANQHFERALQLQRQGDWAGYGDEIKKLGEALKKLAAPQR